MQTETMSETATLAIATARLVRLPGLKNMCADTH